MENLRNVIVKSFEVAGQKVKVRTFLDEDTAQILVDNQLVAEYGFGGCGCTVIKFKKSYQKGWYFGK